MRFPGVERGRRRRARGQRGKRTAQQSANSRRDATAGRGKSTLHMTHDYLFRVPKRLIAYKLRFFL